MYPNRIGGDLLTPDEAAVWEYLRHVEAERDKLLAAEVGTLPLLSPHAPVAVDPMAEVEPPVGVVHPAVVLADATENSAPPTATPIATADETPEDTAAEKRARATRELLADPTASNPTLAIRANCSDETIRRVRHALQDEGRLLPVASVVKANGASYPIATPKDSQAEAVGEVVN